jgi:hypothetical protein
MEGSTASPRARLVFAGGLLAAMVVVIVVVVVAGGSGEAGTEVAEAPPECIDAWNGDRDAVLTGSHQSTAHGYVRVQATRVGPDGSLVEGDDGDCAMIFAAPTLDAEAAFAAQVYDGNKWKALANDRGVQLERLGELQSQALGSANAELTAEGTIEPTTP